MIFRCCACEKKCTSKEADVNEHHCDECGCDLEAEDDLTEDRDKWKSMALAAEEELKISKKLYAQKCDAHMALETEVMRLKRMLLPPITSSNEPPIYGGWYLCPECRRPVTNGEKCKNCEKPLDNRA